MLVVSIRTLKNWEKEGKLHPRTGPRMINGASREVVLYHPKEIREILVKRAFLARARVSPQAAEGEIAARAFELYGEGSSVVDVVTKLRITPVVADSLREQWERMGGVEMVIHQAARDQLIQILGPFDGVADLVSRIRERLAPSGPVQATGPAQATSAAEARDPPKPSSLGLDVRSEARSTGETG